MSLKVSKTFSSPRALYIGGGSGKYCTLMSNEHLTDEISLLFFQFQWSWDAVSTKIQWFANYFQPISRWILRQNICSNSWMLLFCLIHFATSPTIQHLSTYSCKEFCDFIIHCPLYHRKIKGICRNLCTEAAKTKINIECQWPSVPQAALH